MCDFDLMFRNSKHQIVKVIYHAKTNSKLWLRDYKHSTCPANRGGVYTDLKENPHQSWERLHGLKGKIEKHDFDYICLGNGNDDAGKWIRDNIKANFLYSEYGWLPWKNCFYIDDKGTGALSSINTTPLNNMKTSYNSINELIEIKSTMNQHNIVPFDNFIYVPLQVDTPTSDGKPDFKFQFTWFKTNAEFLKFIQKIVPKDITILVKNHPSNRNPTKIPASMIDVSNMNLNKYELYSKMKAMMAINSTSVLEAMLFEKNIFTYGRDVFSNKNVTYESIKDKDRFMSLIDSNNNAQNQRKFISYILQRQFNRNKYKDLDYINNHYWNEKLI